MWNFGSAKNDSMKVLIVGGSSSVGKAVNSVLSEFSEVITAGRTNCNLVLDLSYQEGELRLPENIDTVIHTAAHFGGRTNREMVEAEEVNALGTLRLCQAAVKAKAKHFILISSIFCSVENRQPTIYSLSKRHGEEMAEFYCSSNSLPLTIIRPSQLYGDEDSFRRHQPFFYSIVDKAEKGEDVVFYGSNDAKRNFLHVDDLTQVIKEVVKKMTEGIYACANISDITYSQIAEAAFSAFNKKGNIEFLRNKDDIPDNVFKTDSSLFEKIGYYPQITIEEGMKKLAKYRSLGK
jgi:nucleoside-diphosphate-sugar epimerase